MQARILSKEELWRKAKDFFPEHQIYLRTNGKVRFVTLGSGVQIGLSVVLLTLVGWMAVTTFLYFTQDIRLAAKDQQIWEISDRFDALTADMSVLETDLAHQAEILEARQEILHSVIEQGLVDGVVRLDDIANIETENDTLTPNLNIETADQEPERRASVEPLPYSVSGLYRVRYQHIAQSQDAFAGRLLAVAQKEVDFVSETLARLDLSIQSLFGSQPQVAGMGGPLVLASLPVSNVTLDSDVDSPFGQLIDQWQDLLYVRRAMMSVPALVPVDEFFVSSTYGRRRDPITGTAAVHYGMDLAAWYGSKVKAATDGVVTRAGYMPGYGRMVEIDHGNGFKTRYGHLRKVLVKKSQKLELGATIGESGNSGRSTGPHLHYEIWFKGKPVNPKPYLEASAHVLQIQRRKLDTD